MTITVITPATRTERGTEYPDWENAANIDEEWSNFQPLSAEEITALGRQGVKTLRKAFGPVDTILNARCRARVDGVVYEVVSVEPWASITGSLAHSEAVLQRVEG